MGMGTCQGGVSERKNGMHNALKKRWGMTTCPGVGKRKVYTDMKKT